jgi:hypothetical protein
MLRALSPLFVRLAPKLVQLATQVHFRLKRGESFLTRCLKATEDRDSVGISTAGGYGASGCIQLSGPRLRTASESRRNSLKRVSTRRRARVLNTGWWSSRWVRRIGLCPQAPVSGCWWNQIRSVRHASSSPDMIWRANVGRPGPERTLGRGMGRILRRRSFGHAWPQQRMGAKLSGMDA